MLHKPTPSPATFSADLLAHFDAHARPLPWRRTRDPYHVWLAEIMLQQTTVAAVTPYYERFLAAFPTLESLANAEPDDILHLWQGLGYYSRARNLHTCAQTVVCDHASQFPATAADLQALPGIGPYTAAAIAAIAYDEPATVVDGNVERVIARLFALETPLPAAKPRIRALAATLTPQNRAGDYAGAIMDLGATICTPRNPRCDVCPVRAHCAAAALGIAPDLPKRTRKKPRPHKTGTAYVLTDPTGRLYLRRRPATGLLASLWEVPTTGWEAPELPGELAAHMEATTLTPLGTVHHVFTHFSLALAVQQVSVTTAQPHWHAPDALPPLPTLMRKIIDLAG